jgi:DNA-binding transcriptional LysR family regulator
MLDASPSALRAFVLVATQRSFSKAAAELGTRQSTVSSQIARLEELVGQPLLERSTRRVALAPAGKRLLPLAIDIIELHTVAAARVHDALLTGSVRFGATETLWTTFSVSEALGRFARSHPEVAVSIHIESSEEITRLFKQGGLDLCMTVNPANPGNGRLIRRERLRWYGRAGDPQSEQPLPLVETPYETVAVALRTATSPGNNGQAPIGQFAMRGASVAASSQAISNGLGVGALPVGFAEALELPVYTGDLPALPSEDVYLLSNEAPGEAAVALRNQLLQRLSRSTRSAADITRAANSTGKRAR